MSNDSAADFELGSISMHDLDPSFWEFSLFQLSGMGKLIGRRNDE